MFLPDEGWADFPWLVVSVIESVPLMTLPVSVRWSVCECACHAFCCRSVWLMQVVLAVGRHGVLGATVLDHVRVCGEVACQKTWDGEPQ